MELMDWRPSPSLAPSTWQLPINTTVSPTTWTRRSTGGMAHPLWSFKPWPQMELLDGRLSHSMAAIIWWWLIPTMVIPAALIRRSTGGMAQCLQSFRPWPHMERWDGRPSPSMAPSTWQLPINTTQTILPTTSIQRSTGGMALHLQSFSPWPQTELDAWRPSPSMIHSTWPSPISTVIQLFTLWQSQQPPSALPLPALPSPAPPLGQKGLLGWNRASSCLQMLVRGALVFWPCTSWP